MKKAKQLNRNRFAKHGSYTPEWVAPDRTAEYAAIEAKKAEAARIRYENELRRQERRSKRSWDSARLLALLATIDAPVYRFSKNYRG